MSERLPFFLIYFTMRKVDEKQTENAVYDKFNIKNAENGSLSQNFEKYDNIFQNDFS